MSLTLLCFPVFKVLLKIQIIIHEVYAEAQVSTFLTNSWVVLVMLLNNHSSQKQKGRLAISFEEC